MNRFVLAAVLPILFGLANALNAQTTPPEQDLDEVFGRDEGISFDHVLRFSALDVVRGEANLSYEAILFDRLGLEAGAGLLLPWFLPELITWNTDYVDGPRLSYGWKAALRYYPGFEVREGGYYGFLYRSRRFRSDLGSTTFRDVALMGGYHYPFRERLFIDFSYGVGYFWFDLMPGQESFADRSGVTIPIFLQLAYLL